MSEAMIEFAGGAVVALLILVGGWFYPERFLIVERRTWRVMAVMVGLIVFSAAAYDVSERAKGHGRREGLNGWESIEFAASLRECEQGCAHPAGQEVPDPVAQVEFCAEYCECAMDDLLARNGIRYLMRRDVSEEDADAAADVSVEHCFSAHPEWVSAYGEGIRPRSHKAEDLNPELSPASFDVEVIAEPMPAFYPYRNEHCPPAYTVRGEWCMHPGAVDWSDERLEEATEAYRRGAAPPMILPPRFEGHPAP